MRTINTEKLQQLETTVQEKLEQAQSRRAQMELEQKEKLRNHVSTLLAHPGILAFHYFFYDTTI